MIELKTGKYKGVEFLFGDMSTTGGNRIIKFNFVGSDRQAVERQGALPKTFNLTIVIPHDRYFQEKSDILRVLDDGENGTLTHPTFGDIENVAVGAYSLTEAFSEIGRAQVSVAFEINDAVGVPVRDGDLPAQVRARSDELNDQAQRDLGNQFVVSNNAPANFTDASLSLVDVSNAMNSASQFGDPLAGKIAGFRQGVNAFSASARNLIQSPANLALGVRDMFEGLNALYDTPSTLLGALSLLFTFGDGDDVIDPATAGLIERKQNRDAMRSAIKVQALSFGYVAASEIDYATTDDLDVVQADLEAQYRSARDGLTSGDAREHLDLLRTQAQRTLDTVRVRTQSIVTVKTPAMPLSVFVYGYYGSTELVPTIAELNDIKQGAFVAGDIKVLTL